MANVMLGDLKKDGHISGKIGAGPRTLKLGI